MKKIISWTAVLLWMALIFYLSSQPADKSDQLSTGITETIIRAIGKVIPGTETAAGRLNHIVRKNAHFISYMILGILTVNALRQTGAGRTGSFAWTMVICVLYASSDEIHQLFVPGRAGMVTDVLIDSSGALMGSGIMTYLRWEKHGGSKKSNVK